MEWHHARTISHETRDLGFYLCSGVYAGTKVSERFRVMLFRRGQKTSEAPWMVFNYDAKDDPNTAIDTRVKSKARRRILFS